MTINNAVLKNCLKLSSKITVYVPATNGIDKAADNTEQVKKTAALLSELFGGATSTPARWATGCLRRLAWWQRLQR